MRDFLAEAMFSEANALIGAVGFNYEQYSDRHYQSDDGYAPDNYDDGAMGVIEDGGTQNKEADINQAILNKAIHVCKFCGQEQLFWYSPIEDGKRTKWRLYSVDTKKRFPLVLHKCEKYTPKN